MSGICELPWAHDAHHFWDVVRSGIRWCMGRYTYVTMTRGGMFGGTFTAPNDEHAVAEAKRRGYTVIDILDGAGFGDGDAILIVVR